MSKSKSKILQEKINLLREELEQTILTNNILTRESLFLSRKLDKLIIQYYRIKQILPENS